MWRKVRIVLFNLFLLVALLEISLRLVPFLKTSSEKSEGKYVDYYGASVNSWYHTRPANTEQIIASKGCYSYSFKTNSLGFREKEIAKEKKDSCYRIIVLGDSYAEGVGAHYDSTWPNFLSRLLNENCQKNFEVINSGVSGSDPYYEYVLLRDKLLQYNPDAVIVGVNTSDIYDYIYRGGMERFLANGKTVYKKGPWFLPLYHYSYTFRLILHSFFGYGRAFTRRADFDDWNKTATDSIAGVLNDMNELCKRNNIKFLSIVHPNGTGATRSFKSPFLKWLGYDLTADISPVNRKVNYRNNIDISADISSCINKGNYKEFVWESDKHYTAKGYEHFANAVYINTIATDSFFFGDATCIVNNKITKK